MRKALIGFLAVLPFGLVMPALSQTIDILHIYNQFVVSQTIMSQCGKIDPELYDKNFANFEIVRRRAEKKLHAMRPELTEKDIKAALEKDRMAKINAAAEAVKERGCDHPSVQHFIKLFKIHAEWDSLSEIDGERL